MELQLVTGASHTLQTVSVALFALALLYFLPIINVQTQLRKLPPLLYDGKRVAYYEHAKKIYSEGYRRFKDQVYRLTTSDGIEVVVIPPRYLSELRKLPDSVLSFPRAAGKSLEAKYTKINTDVPIVAHTIKADLTPALVRLNPIICAEVDEAMRDEMPPCKDWTSVGIYMTLARVVAKVSGRVFVGPELCRNQDYLDCGLNYTMELVNAFTAIKKMNPWLKPILAPRCADVQRLRERERIAMDFMRPIVQARREAEKDPDYQKPDDVLQWLLNRSSEFGNKSIREMARIQLGIIFAAIHTTTVTATNVLYNLAVSPEYIPLLRDEIRTAMANNDGIITSRALQKMEKLDSYMKETMRFYPPGFTSFNRRVLKGFTLSNGQYIPPDVDVEIPSYAVYQDAANFPDSDTFDGLRFYKLRQQGGSANHARNQFVTTNEQNLGFGYGRHACPGRFFAANEIKMILARLILEYDFKNTDGITERYPNFEMGRASAPDASRNLLFRKAEV